MNDSLFNSTVIVQHIMRKIDNKIHNGKDNTIKYNFMIGESLLVLEGHSRSHVTCEVLCPF